MAFFNSTHSMADALARLEILIGKAREVIGGSPRPTDAFPIEEVQPFFVVNSDHLDGWQSQIDQETLKRLSLFARPNVLVETEERLQAQPYALSPKELAAFRAGIPVLKMRFPLQIRDTLPKGGRTKDAGEIALRHALAFEVYRRDIELRAIEALRARKDGRLVDPTETPKTSLLADMVWVEDFPRKGQPVKTNREGSGPADADAWCDVLEALRDEGRKLVLVKAIGASRPEEVQAAIIADVFRHDTPGLTSADLDAASTESARQVELLMRAYRHATRIAERKHDLSGRLRKHLSQNDGRRTRPYDPVQVEIMTKLDHSIITANHFTARELVEIAILADIDPNLVCTSHALASVEFGIARKLGRYGRGEDIVFSALEVEWLRYYVLPETPSGPASMYDELHELLAGYALKLLPLWKWRARIEAAGRR